MDISQSHKFVPVEVEDAHHKLADETQDKARRRPLGPEVAAQLALEERGDAQGQDLLDVGLTAAGK